MNYGLSVTPTANDTECLVIGLFSDNNLSDSSALLDQEHHVLIKRLANKLTENGDSAWQTDFNGRCVLVMHCGNKANYTADILSKRMADITGMLIKQHLSSATICMPQLAQHTPDWQVQQMLLHCEAQRYQLLDFKSKKNKPCSLECLHFFLPNATDSALKSAQAIAHGVQFARTLANYPANVCTPLTSLKKPLSYLMHTQN